MRKRKKKLPDVSPNKVVAYIRVSTAQQADGGHSLEAQQAKLETYAAALGLEVVAIEIDAGFSASTAERPGLQRALLRIAAGEAHGILVTKLDRLTRNVRDFVELVEMYFKDGTRSLRSVSETIDTSTVTGRLILNVLMIFSQWEREAAAERTADVMARMQQLGKYTGGFPPFGYDTDEDGNLIENAAEQVVIEQAKYLRGTGASLRKIASALSPNHRTGKAFAAQQIAGML
jgi:site-specific DNA recombinase